MELNNLAIVVAAPYQNDALFDSRSKLNRDDCLAPFGALKKRLEAAGGRCHTHDRFESQGLEASDMLFLDMPVDPGGLRGCFPGARLHLLIQECEVVVPANWVEANYQAFDTVFSWSPALYQRGGKFIRVNFSQNLAYRPGARAFDAKRLCTLISGNKRTVHPFELYSARQEVIDWFEARGPDLFDFYGVGWDRASTANRYLNKLLKVTPLGHLLARRYRTYRGMVDCKLDTLQDYRFCICYENAHSIPGYVTEKIFDALMAGCVPVYWGAPDITDYVPGDCFIDRLAYGSMEELVEVLRALPESRYQQYRERIAAYLESEQAQYFSTQHFAGVIAERVLQRG